MPIKTQFKVADVEVNKETRKHYRTDLKDTIESLAGAPVEAHSRSEKPILYGASYHALVSAVHSSFANHYPLQLSPDAIWLTLTMGLAKHIEKNAEALRQHFVAHQGKVKIGIQRDSFVRGNPDNDWPGCFEEFSTKIREYIGDATHRRIVADYSTTTPVDKAASEVVLMDAMKQYFDYEVSTLCGIPNITLTGKVEDWESIRDKVQGWAEWDLSWWVTPMTQILDQFVNAAKGQVDREWWNNFYKYHSGSGSGDSSRITGWINWFFPYIKNRQNPMLGKFGANKYDGFTTASYPKSLSSVPFIWDYYGEELKYQFLAGLVAATQDPETMTITPISGWAVRDTTKIRSQNNSW